MLHSQTHLPTLSTYCTNYRRTIIPICPVPFALVGSPTRRVPPVEVLLTFFPRHSETSHLSQYARRLGKCWAAKPGHWLAVAYVSSVRCFSPALTLWQGWRCSLPSALLVSTAPPAEGLGASPRRPSLNRYCRCVGTLDCDTCTPSSRSDGWCGSVEPGSLALCSLDSAGLVHGSAPLSTRCFVAGLATRLLEIACSYFTSFISYQHLFHT
jgi:hypothetical protein